MKLRSITGSVAVLSLFGWPMASLALTTTLGVGAGALHTNNSNKVSVDESSDVEQTVDASVTANHQTSSLTFDLNYDASETRFKHDTQRDESAVNGNASLDWSQVPNLLSWHVDHSVRDLLRGKSLVNTQENREGRSITTGSGSLSTRLGQANTATLTAIYSGVRFEDSNQLDSDRVGATLNLDRSLSAVSNLFLSGSYNEVDFDNRQNNYHYVNSQLGYSAQLSRLSYTIQLGYNEQTLESGKTFDGTSFNLNARYRDAGTTWSATARRQLTDTSRGNNNLSISGLSSSATLTTAEVYERTAAELSYSNSNICAGCNWDVRLLGETERYESESNDNDELAVSTGMSYQWTQLVSLGGNVQYRKVNFNGLVAAADYDVVNYRINMGFALGKNLSMSVAVGFEDYDSDVDTRDYDELTGGLSLFYQIR